VKIVRNNHDDIYPAGPTYIRSVRAGATLYISGCTARGSEAEGGPVLDQLRVTLDRIVRIVEAEGGTAANIVAMTTFATDMTTMWPIDAQQVAVWQHFFKGVWPANAYVEVSALAEPGLDVEITATAVLDDD
jgi:2-iminobutanoate/2-iminopropanoate deaminase